MADMPEGIASARFVGREAAFTRLATVLGGAAEGRAGTLLVSGTAGIGVTRFLNEAARRIGELAEPMTVLRGAASRGPDTPYAPVLEALRSALCDLDDETLGRVTGPASEEAVRLMPELAERLAPLGLLPARPTMTVPERRQARTLEGILGILGRLGEERPVLLILEDLHRADAATRALATFLARIARNQRLALVFTHRPDEVTRDHPWWTDRVGHRRRPACRPRARARAAPPRRARATDRVDRGPARLGERPAARRRAIGRQPARGRGAPGRAPRAVVGVAVRVAPGAGDGSARDPLPGVPPRPAAAGPGRRPPPTLRAGGGGGHLRGRLVPPAAAFHERPAACRGGARRGPDGRARRGDRARVPRRDRRAARVPPRAHRAGRRGRPPPVHAGPLPRRDRVGARRPSRRGRPPLDQGERRRGSPNRLRRSGSGGVGTQRAGGRAGRDRGGAEPRARREGCDGAEGAGRRGCVRGRPGDPCDRVRGGGHRRAGRPPRPRPARAAPRASRALSPGGGGQRGGDGGETAGSGARPARADAGTGDGAGGAGAAPDARRHVLGRRAPCPRGDPHRPRVLAARRGPGGARDHHARGRDGLGEHARGRRPAARGCGPDGSRGRRARRALPGPRQPHDRARPAGPPRRCRRGRLPGDRGSQGGGSRGRVRQLPAGQRQRLPVHPRPLGGGTGLQRDRPRMAAGRDPFPDLGREPRDRGHRDVGRRGGGPAPRADAARARSGARFAARGPVLSRRPPRSPCGAGTSPMPVESRAAAGSWSA